MAECLSTKWSLKRENIHWIKPEKIDIDLKNPQIHGFFDNFDFIAPHHKVLLFIRGDDVIEGPVFGEGQLKQWSMMFGRDRTLNAKRIAAVSHSSIE